MSNVAVDAYWGIELNIETSLGWTCSGAAASGGVVGIGVLEGVDVDVELLISTINSGEGDGDDGIGDSGGNIDSPDDVWNKR